MATFYRITLDWATAEADKAVIQETGALVAKAIWTNKMPSPADVRRLSRNLAATPALARKTIDALPQSPLTYAKAHASWSSGSSLRKVIRPWTGSWSRSFLSWTSLSVIPIHA